MCTADRQPPAATAPRTTPGNCRMIVGTALPPARRSRAPQLQQINTRSQDYSRGWPTLLGEPITQTPGTPSFRILRERVRASVPHSGVPQPSPVINGCNRLKRILASLGEAAEKVREVVHAKSNELVGEGATLIAT